jgi:Transposase DDE domain group 1
VSNRSGFYPCPSADAGGSMVVSQAGGLVLTETIRAVGLDRELSKTLTRWRLPLAIHDPGKVIADLAVMLALGGDCLADIALVRAEPAVYGLVASDPTVSRTITRLAQDAPAVLAAIAAARAAARARAWRLAGARAPDHGVDRDRPLIVDVDATLVTAHSDKEGAAATFKRGFGHHPLWAFLDHGPDGTGEPLSMLLRPGNAGSNTATDHVTVLRNALRQIPGHRAGTRPGRTVLIRIDGAGATHGLLDWIVGQRMSYSVGFTLPTDFGEQLAKIPKKLWTPAYNSDGEIRDGAWVAEITGLLNLDSWPTGMRVIARRERPHPGAQLRITDADGLRVTAFATNTAPGGPGRQLPDLELRHRRRARAEDRIRCAKDTGLTNLPLHDLDQNRIWCALVALACEITAWTQMLALAEHPARRWEPKRLRLRLFSIAGRLARSGRRTVLHLATHSPWTGLIVEALTSPRALAEPD